MTPSNQRKLHNPAAAYLIREPTQQPHLKEKASQQAHSNMEARQGHCRISEYGSVLTQLETLCVCVYKIYNTHIYMYINYICI